MRLAPHDDRNLIFDHVHLSAPDQAEAAQWYMRNMGATPGASPERVLVGEGLWIIFYKVADAKPSHAGVIDSMGFSFPDAVAKMKQLESAGATVVAPASERPGLFTMGVIEDPFGARITVVQDSETLGFHHVHLRLPDPDAAFAWYLEMFGGERARLKGLLDAVRYGRVWLLADRGASAPSQGHAIDHLGWRTPRLDTKAAELKAKHVTFTMEPRQFNETVRISFVEGPEGTRIEVLERA